MSQDQEIPIPTFQQPIEKTQLKQNELKETIKSLNNHFNNLNKEIDILKETKESILLNREIAELKIEMDKLRMNHNKQMKSIEVLGQSIHSLQDEDVFQNPWSEFIY